jgi:hypothetical protein
MPMPSLGLYTRRALDDAPMLVRALADDLRYFAKRCR